jgi:ABC-type amino acid transport system permease subunit
MQIQENQMWGYFEWLFYNFGLLNGLLIAAAVAVLGFLACFLIAMARYGPGEGFYQVTQVIYEFIARDLPRTSGRRVYALSRLAFQEAIRRKVLVVMAVFIVGLLFAGWFLDPGSGEHRPAVYQLRNDRYQLYGAVARIVLELL